MTVDEAIEELLYSQGGPCVYHRYKIAELLKRQEEKIGELTNEVVGLAEDDIDETV